MNDNRDLHSTKALAVATNEVVSLGIIEEYEVLATAPVPYCTIQGAVVIPSLVYLEHIVLVLLVPKCCIQQRIWFKIAKRQYIQKA